MCVSKLGVASFFSCRSTLHIHTLLRSSFHDLADAPDQPAGLSISSFLKMVCFLHCRVDAPAAHDVEQSIVEMYVVP